MTDTPLPQYDSLEDLDFGNFTIDVKVDKSAHVGIGFSGDSKLINWHDSSQPALQAMLELLREQMKLNGWTVGEIEENPGEPYASFSITYANNAILPSAQDLKNLVELAADPIRGQLAKIAFEDAAARMFRMEKKPQAPVDEVDNVSVSAPCPTIKMFADLKAHAQAYETGLTPAYSKQ